jgi:hypothetical protein
VYLFSRAVVTSRDREGAGKLRSPFTVIHAWGEHLSDPYKCLRISGLGLTRSLTVAARLRIGHNQRRRELGLVPR